MHQLTYLHFLLIRAALPSVFALLLATAASAIEVMHVDWSTFDVQPRIVSTTNAQNSAHVTTPGNLVNLPGVAPLNVDGVGDMLITKGNLLFRCSGTLLPGGTAFLTAAHCLTDESGVIDADSVSITFHLPGPNVTVSSAAFTIHPDWNGSVLNGADVAVVTFNTAVSAAVPRYDIYRGLDSVNLGEPNINVGYGQGGNGTNGASGGSGTKRAGLNSYDGAFTAGNYAVLGFDFDNGNSANDAFFQVFGAGFAHTGFGANEVNSAPGDSGGPTFIEANDTILELTGGGNVGTFIVGGGSTQFATLEKSGTNSTTYSVTFSGDAVNGNIASALISDPSDVQDHKIAGLTSFGGQFANGNNGADVLPGTNSSFGEFSFDTPVVLFQDFLDPFIDNSFTPFATQLIAVDLDDATAGNKLATVTVENLATTSEGAGRGSADPNDQVMYTATVLDHSEASFDANNNVDSLSLNFGAFALNSGIQLLAFDIFNLESMPSFTAALDLDAVNGSGDIAVLTTDLSPFTNLAAGNFNSFLAMFDTSTAGIFNAVFTLTVSDENLPGAINGAALTLNLTGTVFEANLVPEPACLTMLALGLCGIGMYLRRRAPKV